VPEKRFHWLISPDQAIFNKIKLYIDKNSVRATAQDAQANFKPESKYSSPAFAQQL
jgi:hypothetical protein